MAIQWNRRTYTEQEFRDAWLSSLSIAEVTRKLDLSLYGSTYSTMKDTAITLGLTKEHFTGAGWRKGLSTPAGKGIKMPLEFYLVKDKKVSSGNLKKRLIAEGILVEECAAPFCPVPNPSVNPFTGEATTLKLALDHISGDNTDNRLENLRLLCYHCHGETETFAGSNTERKSKKIYNTERGFKIKNKAKYFCECGAERYARAKQCGACYANARKSKSKLTLTVEEILALLETNHTYEGLGKKYGITGNGIRAFLRRNGVTPPKSKYVNRKKVLENII